jgi:hypothetical protein
MNSDGIVESEQADRLAKGVRFAISTVGQENFAWGASGVGAPLAPLPPGRARRKPLPLGSSRAVVSGTRCFSGLSTGLQGRVRPAIGRLAEAPR